MDHTKATILGIATAIATVTLALATATVAVIVVTMPVQKAGAAEHCVGNANHAACSGSKGSHSCNSALGTCGFFGPGGGTNLSNTRDSSGELHHSLSTTTGGQSDNPGQPSACSGSIKC